MAVRDKYLYYLEHVEELMADGREAVQWTEDQVKEKFVVQSSVFLDWSFLQSMSAYEIETQEKLLKETIIPDTREMVRERFAKADEKATVDRVDDQMKLNPVYREAVTRLSILSYVGSILSDIVAALCSREKCLQSVNARHGKELSFYPPTQ